MFTRVRLLVLAVCVLVVAAGCQVGVEVAIDVAEDGSGLVTLSVSLDEEAVSQIRDLEGALVVSDAEEAGWTVTGPEVESDGLTWIRASKPFSSPEQLTPIMEEIAGEDGAFQNFVLLREKSFAELNFTLTGLIDLTQGPTAFSDAAVEEILGADDDLAARIAALEEAFGPVEDNVTVELTVDVPGGAEGDPGEGGQVFVASFADTEPTQVATSGSDENLSARLWRWVGIAALVLFGIAVVVGLVGWLMERRARHRQLPAPSAQPASSEMALAARGQLPAQPPPVVQARAPVVGQPQAAPAPPQRSLQLVVLDPAGVVFDLVDDPRERLIPFVRARGSEVADDEIVETYREASLGRIGTAEMWPALGVEGDAAEIDSEYLSTVTMRRGAAEFLAEMNRRGMDVAFLGNMPMEWAILLRAREGTATVRLWVISGAVGVRNPDPGILEALRRESGVPFENCLLVDARVVNLDAAKVLGMSTAWYTESRPPPEVRPAHSVVTHFSEFFRRPGTSQPPQ